MTSEFNQVVIDGAKRVFRTIRRFFLALLILVVLGFAGYVWVCNWTYSEGARAGTLIKLSRKGVVFKTYEGQLNLGGFRTDDESGVIGNVWEFSVLRKDLYQQLQEMEGQRVKLHYRQKYKAMPWQGKTDYFVYRMEVVK